MSLGSTFLPAPSSVLVFASQLLPTRSGAPVFHATEGAMSGVQVKNRAEVNRLLGSRLLYVRPSQGHAGQTGVRNSDLLTFRAERGNVATNL